MSLFFIFSYSYLFSLLFVFFYHTSTNNIYTLSLHDALPISGMGLKEVEIDFSKSKNNMIMLLGNNASGKTTIMSNLNPYRETNRSEEHTSELQSRFDLVCRLLLEKKINNNKAGSSHQCKLLL